MLKSNQSHHLYGFTDLKTLNERGPVVISHGKGIYVYDIQNKKTGEVKEIFCSYSDKEKASQYLMKESCNRLNRFRDQSCVKEKGRN